MDKEVSGGPFADDTGLQEPLVREAVKRGEEGLPLS